MDKYRTEILHLLKPLSFQKQLVFSALICEKLLPNYIHFSQTVSWGNPLSLQNAISVIYQNVFRNDLFTSEEMQDLISEIELVTPDTEDFESILVSFALDSCTSLLSTLNFIIDKEIDNVADVATYSRDTIDMYIQERDDLSLDDKMLAIKIEQDFFMQKEKQRQRTVLKLLLEMNEITDAQLQRLREIQPLPIVDLSLLPSI